MTRTPNPERGGADEPKCSNKNSSASRRPLTAAPTTFEKKSCLLQGLSWQNHHFASQFFEAIFGSVPVQPQRMQQPPPPPPPRGAIATPIDLIPLIDDDNVGLALAQVAGSKGR